MIDVCLSQPQRIKESVPLRECQPTAASKQRPEYRSPAHTTPSKRPRLDTKTLFDSLFKSYPCSSIFTIVPGYAIATPTPDPAREPELPPPLTSLFASKYTSCTTPQALRLSELKASTITCTQQQADFLEASTRQQSSSVLWFEHRIGRITASVLGKVSRCQNTSYPYSIVRSIMQYSKPPTNVPSLKWGRQNEAIAREQYIAQHSQQHTNLQVQLCGLHISTDHPYLAATPDGIVSCDCCGEGLLEIKCPFKYKDDILADITDSAFYLERQPTGEMKLKTSHNYYLQVQAQLSVCRKTYCDFVCWSTASMHVERIQADAELINSLQPKLSSFFTNYLMPELLTNKLKLTGSPHDPNEECEEDVEEGLFCICREPAYGTMIACDGPECQNEWFHYQCVGLDTEPAGDWFCSECRSVS